MSASRKFQQLEAIAQKAYAAAKPTNLTPPQTFGNATTEGKYVPPVWPVWAGADEHLAHASVGMGAQIARAV